MSRVDTSPVDTSLLETGPSEGVPPRHASRVDVWIGLGAVALVLLFCAPRLIENGGDVESFLFLGETATARPCLEGDFDHPELVPHAGHDGQMNYLIARDLPDVDRSAPCLDWPQYRWRRILYPALAAPFGEGDSLVVAMVAINLAAVAAAAIALARLARQAGASPWAGLGIAVSPGIVMAVADSLADPLAYALGLLGILAWRRHAVGWSLVAFTLAGLTRETALLAVVACLCTPEVPWRRRAALAVPFAVVGSWAVVVDQVVPARGAVVAMSQLALPFRTYLDAISGPDAGAALMGLALMIVSARAAWVLRRRLPELAAWIALDAVVLACVAPIVMTNAGNLARVAGLAVPGLAVATTLRRRGNDVTGDDQVNSVSVSSAGISSG
jgi:hypothetical protein